MSDAGDSCTPPTSRLWLLCFYDGETPTWWQKILKPGFRHVCACCYFADIGMWVYYNPTRRGTEIQVARPDDFAGRWAQLARDCAAILRFPSQADRNATPLSWWCVGAMKALLGIRSGALSPYQLYRDLRAHGAEEVDLEHFRHSQDSGGGPSDESIA